VTLLGTLLAVVPLAGGPAEAGPASAPSGGADARAAAAPAAGATGAARSDGPGLDAGTQAGTRTGTPPRTAPDSPGPGAVSPGGPSAPLPTGIARRAPAGPTAPDLPAPPVVPPPPARVGLDLAQHATDDPASVWVVVNKARPLTPVEWAPDDLVDVGGYRVRAVVAEPLSRMLAAAAAEGVRLELRSAFRSVEYQRGVHADVVARIGQERADEVSARPGHSEHQTGLAVDVGSGSQPACDFEACFGDTAEGRWVAARAGEFGLVVRYTAANREVTGYAPEGWHLRWVGADLVAEMQRRGVTTLEELFGVPGGPQYR